MCFMAAHKLVEGTSDRKPNHRIIFVLQKRNLFYVETCNAMYIINTSL